GGAGLLRQYGGRAALGGVALEEGAHRLGAQTLAHLLELPQFIRHACLVLALAVDLGQPSHHRSIRSDFDVPVATTTHPAVWFPENVTAQPLSRRTVRKRTCGGLSLIGPTSSRQWKSATGCARSRRCRSSRSNSTVISASGAGRRATNWSTASRRSSRSATR